jgi:hypothetical protein
MVGLLSLAFFLAGCGRDDIQVYRVAKERPQAPSQAAMPASGSETASAMPRLKYNLPAGWQEVSPGEMRAAAFHIAGKDGKQADLGVVPLPGLMGRDLENVNRWRGSVGLPAVTEEDLPKLVQPVPIAGQAGQMYEQAGENPGSGEKTRILVAILRREGVAWFFKMNGDDEVVLDQKPAFVEFLKTASFTAAQAQPELPPSYPPIGGPVSPPATETAAASSEGKPTWQVPPGWREVAGGQFLVAKFTIAGADNAQAAVNVSMSGGDGGGLAGNVNRWRKQLGLGELSDTDLAKEVSTLDTAQGKVSVVDFSGTDGRTGQKARLVGAVVPQGGQTWFYKLMGSESVVAAQKEAFNKFVQTAKY